MPRAASPRATNRLSHRTVATLKTPGLHADGAGLYLEIDREKTDGDGKPLPQLKRWTYLFQWRGARKQMGLGAVTDVSLAQARDKAAKARDHVLNGRNPIDQRKLEDAREAAITFGDMAEKVLANLETELSNEKHQAQWRRSLIEVAAALNPLPIGDVSTDDVLDVLKPLWVATPESASRTRGRIERVLDAAKAKGLRTGDNPARWRGHLSHLLPKRQVLSRGHHAAMEYQKIGAFMVALRARPAMAAKALEFTILCAARTGETLGATWAEFDLVEKVWNVPAERMKAKRDHRVPLSDAAVDLVRTLRDELPEKPAPEAYVFTAGVSTKALSNMAMDMLLRRMGHEDVTVHGFRSAFKDWAANETDYPDETSEEALAHIVGSKVRQAYRRGDALEKRRALMEGWASWCATARGQVARMPAG